MLREGHRRSHFLDLFQIPREIRASVARGLVGGCPILAQQGWGTDKAHDGPGISSVPHPSHGAKDGARGVSRVRFPHAGRSLYSTECALVYSLFLYSEPRT